MSPLAVCCLVLSAVAEHPLHQLAESISSLLILAAGLATTMLFHSCAVVPGLAYAFLRQSPLPHMQGVGRAVATAFGSASSAVTLPISIRCCENLGYRPGVIRFVLSLGTTISMVGPMRS